MSFKTLILIVTLVHLQKSTIGQYYNPWSQCYRSISWERNIQNQLFNQKQREINVDIGGKIAAYSMVLNPIKDQAQMNSRPCAANTIRNIDEFFVYAKIIQDCRNNQRMQTLINKQMVKIDIEREKLNIAQNNGTDVNQACEVLRKQLYEINQETTQELNVLGDECFECSKQRSSELTTRCNELVYEYKACQ